MIDTIRDHRPRLLLVDDPTNLQVLRHVWQNDWRLQFATDGERSFDVGCVDYITKPISVSEPIYPWHAWMNYVKHGYKSCNVWAEDLLNAAPMHDVGNHAGQTSVFRTATCQAIF